MRARILPPTAENIELAAQSLRRGEVVGLPTETVYGLAGSALDPDALALIFGTKERPTFDPLIVHVGIGLKSTYALAHAELIDGRKLSNEARTLADALIAALWPGPLTLVLPKHERVPDLATSGLPGVALRMPSHRVAQWVLAASGLALAAPSANRFGRISPTTAQAVAEELGDRIDVILDGGACEIGVESTVVRIEESGALTLLRPGGVSRARLEEVAGRPLQGPEKNPAPSPAGAAQAAPGMLDSHYAPLKPLYLLPREIASLDAADWRRIVERTGGRASFALLLQKSVDPDSDAAKIRTLLTQAGVHGSDVNALSLSRAGDLQEAARALFAHLRSLDASSAAVILAEPCSGDQGLGHAIADRLRRAAREVLS